MHHGPQPLRRRASGGFRRLRITSGEWRAGDRLPTERSLSADLGVGRGAIREAIAGLSNSGLVQAVQGSGTRVLGPSRQLAKALMHRTIAREDYRPEDLCEVRLLLETAIAELAATRRTDLDIGRLEATQAVLGNPQHPT